ncbi:unnamed protein product, partial [Rotaria sp. Silwood1]
RTTLVIAHRLSTIRNADKIIVMQKGETIEEGDHDSLMKARGTYFHFVEQQNLHEAGEKEKLDLEQNKAAKEIILSDQTQLDNSDTTRKRESRLVSSSSSTLSLLTENLEENDDETMRKKKKRRQNIPLAILKMNKPEWLLIICGCIAAFFVGTLNPSFGIIRTKFIMIFQECDENVQNRQVFLYTLLFVGLAIVGFIFQLLYSFMFAYSGEILIKRLRSETFRAILRQEIAFFDQEKHTTGTLCTRLATEATAVQDASGVRFGFLCQNLVSLGMGIIVGFVFSWQLTLLTFAFLSLMIVGSYLQIRLTSSFERKDEQFIGDAGKLTVEAIQNIRTVAQLTKEDHFYNEYSRLLNIIYRIFNAVTFTVETACEAIILSPNYGKAINAAEKIFELLNRKPLINNESKDGDEIPNFTGQLEFDGIYFVYPNRFESIILRDFKLNIKAGQKLALVGASGCGKSTTMQLIQRFYDANIGHLLVDSKDIRSLNLQWYRSQISIVSQEPVLFDRSIRENIAYGDNNRENIPLDEIIQAAKISNIHNFIQQLPDGYETNCGPKGIQLSGGQKQRIGMMIRRNILF